MEVLEEKANTLIGIFYCSVAIFFNPFMAEADII